MLPLSTQVLEFRIHTILTQTLSHKWGSYNWDNKDLTWLTHFMIQKCRNVWMQVFPIDWEKAKKELTKSPCFGPTLWLMQLICKSNFSLSQTEKTLLWGDRRESYRKKSQLFLPNLSSSSTSLAAWWNVFSLMKNICTSKSFVYASIHTNAHTHTIILSFKRWFLGVSMWRLDLND